MRERWFVALVVLTFAYVAIVIVAHPKTEKAPRFVVGKTYTFAIDCGIRDSFERSDTDDSITKVQVNDCYQEPLQVRKVLEDGWLEVVDMRDERPTPTVWTVNPARVWGFAPLKNPHQREASLGR